MNSKTKKFTKTYKHKNTQIHITNVNTHTRTQTYKHRHIGGINCNEGGSGTSNLRQMYACYCVLMCVSCNYGFVCWFG